MRPDSVRGSIGRRELAALAALFVLSLPAVTWRVNASDEVQYFAYLRSLWFDHDVSFDNEYRHFYDRGIARTPGFEATFLEPRTPTGLRENFGTLGSSLLWAPFYAVADLVARLGAGPPDGYSRPYLAAVGLGSATLGFLALVLSIAAARRLTGSGVPAGVAVWFGTPLLFYMYAAPGYAHAPSAFAVAVFVTMWLRVRARWSPRGLAALGAAAALMIMVREQDVVYAAGPAVDYLLHARSRARGDVSAARLAAAALAGGVSFLAVYTPQLLAYLALNGRPRPSELVTRKMSWHAPHAFGVLASPAHGFFAWTPLAILAAAGLLVWWYRSRGGAATVGDRPPGAGPASAPDAHRVAGCLVLMLALQVYVSGSVESWTVAGAFGQRRFVGATILLVIGLAALWQSLPRGIPRIAVTLAAVLSIWWNMGLMALFGAGLMDRQRLHLGENARDVFIRLPQLAPGLAHRYLTDRDSFYSAP